MDPFIGEIRMFGGNFPPRGWAFCDGQLLAIAQNTALFALLGTTYGGNGQTTFALPDLRGRVPAHHGNNFDIGEMTGVENVSLNSNQIPAHRHPMAASTTLPPPTGTGIDLTAAPLKVPASPGKPKTYKTGGDTVMMSPQAVANAGGGQAHNNMAPFLALNFIIALEGVFPQRP